MSRATIPLAIAVPATIAAAIALWQLAPARGAHDPAARPTLVPDAGCAAELAALRAEMGRRDTEVTMRFALLEGRIGELSDALQAERRSAPGSTREAAQVVPQDPLAAVGDGSVAALRAIALDPSRSTRDRVLAAKALWDVDLRTGMTGARTPAVVDALLALLPNEPDAELRRLICFHVLDAAGPAHAPQLVDTLELDPDPRVRAQAADTLQGLQGEPGVRAALERASRSDAEEVVRATAEEMLGRWDLGGQ